MSSRNHTKSYIISGHPYLFDTFFRALRWCGSGQVTLKDIYGGVNEARALVEADHEGYLALKTPGFTVQPLRKHLYLRGPIASRSIRRG